MILAIDFDNVLHDKAHPVEGKKMGAPIEGAKVAMEALKAGGHELIIHTCAADRGTEWIAEWLKYYGIPYDSITNVKPRAAVYLDDKALRFQSWRQTYEDIHVLLEGES